MKAFVKISMLLAALALFFAGCDNTLSQTTPDFGTVNESYGVNGTNKVNGVTAYPNTLFTGTLSAITTPVTNQLTVQFPDIDLDALRETSLTALEAKIKEFLHFYTVRKETNNDNINNNKVNASLRQEITDWKVIRRSGLNVYIEFTGLSNNYSMVIEAKIDSDKYTYRHGQKVDKDGNGIAGEAFYDDYYGYTISVTTDGSNTNMATTTFSDFIRIYNFSVPVNFVKKETGTGTYATSTNLGFQGTATTEQVELSFSIPDDKSTSSYAAMVQAMFAIERRDENGVWQPSGLSPTFTKVAGAQNYYALVTLTHKTVYRFVLNNIKGATLLNDVYGGKTRLQFQFDSGTRSTLTQNKFYSDSIPVENTALDNEYTSNFFSSNAVASDSEGRNVTITLTLNNTVLSTVATGATSPSGLKPLTAALLNKDFKLGLVANSTTGGTTGLPNPPGGGAWGGNTVLPFSTTNPNSWNNITFVNIANAELVYVNTVPSPNTPPDTLVLYLDPGFRLAGTANSKNSAYLFISGNYGFADRVFGNWENYTTGFKGFRAYGQVGSGQF